MFDIIVAMDIGRGIAKNGTIPWQIGEELKYFHEQTTKTNHKLKKNAVIMGRKTWESIPREHRPLSNRINYILSKKEHHNHQNIFFCKSLDNALNLAENNKIIEKIFIIGGESIYSEALKQDKLERILITQIYEDFNCDKHFPHFNESVYSKKRIKTTTATDEKSGKTLKLEYLKYSKKS